MLKDAAALPSPAYFQPRQLELQHSGGVLQFPLLGQFPSMALVHIGSYFAWALHGLTPVSVLSSGCCNTALTGQTFACASRCCYLVEAYPVPRLSSRLPSGNWIPERKWPKFSYQICSKPWFSSVLRGACPYLACSTFISGRCVWWQVLLPGPAQSSPSFPQFLQMSVSSIV